MLAKVNRHRLSQPLTAPDSIEVDGAALNEQTPRAFERCEQCVDRIPAAAGTRGPPATTVADVADHLGVSPATLYGSLSAAHDRVERALMIAWNGCSRSRGTGAQHVWNAHRDVRC
jgi:Bacterial regulatory proteins, tetR family